MFTGLVAALLGGVSAHMIMNTPHPYNLHKSSPLVQVDPLGELPFPCQGNLDVEETTMLKAGQTQLVDFTGGAQHGGGSCQFSVTYENPPPKDKSKWKVLYTVIGGCPTTAEGNLSPGKSDVDGRADSKHCAAADSDERDCIRSFNIPIPKNVKNGKATFAWTWFNKLGNREMYMNCAPVAITGGSDDGAFTDELPDMFVANIAGECSTGSGLLNIPNPGKYGRVLEQPADNSWGNCAAPGGVPTFETFEGVSSDSNGLQVAPAATSAPAATAVARPPNSFVTVVVPSSAVTPPSAPTDSASPSSGTATSSGSAGSGVTCPENGALVCIGSDSFGICDHGSAVAQPLAPGTICTRGQILRRRLAATERKFA